MGLSFRRLFIIYPWKLPGQARDRGMSSRGSPTKAVTGRTGGGLSMVVDRRAEVSLSASSRTHRHPLSSSYMCISHMCSLCCPCTTQSVHTPERSDICSGECCRHVSVCYQPPASSACLLVTSSSLYSPPFSGKGRGLASASQSADIHHSAGRGMRGDSGGGGNLGRETGVGWRRKEVWT